MIVKGKTGLEELEKKSDCYQRNSQSERDGIFNTDPIVVEVRISLIFQWKPDSL